MLDNALPNLPNSIDTQTVIALKWVGNKFTAAPLITDTFIPVNSMKKQKQATIRNGVSTHASKTPHKKDVNKVKAVNKKSLLFILSPKKNSDLFWIIKLPNIPPRPTGFITNDKTMKAIV